MNGHFIKRILLICGILSSLLYVAMNIFIPLRFEGYSYAIHTVSELSAIGAPTRWLWVWLAILYILLFAGFSIGVWLTAKNNRFLRIVSYLMFVYSVINFYWPPMHLRGNEPTFTDTLHIVWAMITVILMMLMMGFGAAAFGNKFRLYSIISMGAHVVFGILTTLEGPNISTNGPTPMIGVWERINIGIFMGWIIMLAIAILRREKSYDSTRLAFDS